MMRRNEMKERRKLKFFRRQFTLFSIINLHLKRNTHTEKKKSWNLVTRVQNEIDKIYTKNSKWNSNRNQIFQWKRQSQSRAQAVNFNFSRADWVIIVIDKFYLTRTTCPTFSLVVTWNMRSLRRLSSLTVARVFLVRDFSSFLPNFLIHLAAPKGEESQRNKNNPHKILELSGGVLQSWKISLLC